MPRPRRRNASTTVRVRIRLQKPRQAKCYIRRGYTMQRKDGKVVTVPQAYICRKGY